MVIHSPRTYLQTSSWSLLEDGTGASLGSVMGSSVDCAALGKIEIPEGSSESSDGNVDGTSEGTSLGISDMVGIADGMSDGISIGAVDVEGRSGRALESETTTVGRVVGTNEGVLEPLRSPADVAAEGFTEVVALEGTADDMLEGGLVVGFSVGTPSLSRGTVGPVVANNFEKFHKGPI